MFNRFALVCLIITMTGCALYGVTQFDTLYGEPAPQLRMTQSHDREAIHYLDTVKPIIESRCVVCHGCYDAPCQLKLSSPEGINRGITDELVYDGARLLAATPQRLFLDAHTTEQWRERGFKPVLNEHLQHPDVNLAASVMHQSLVLKLAHPLPEQAVLGDEFDFSLDRNQSCPSAEGYQQFAQDNPLAGMPYGFPGLSQQEFSTLQAWLMDGAKMAQINEPSVLESEQVARWEAFLNQSSNKHQLMARYIYEHWFLAHIYFDAQPNRSFFKLVRSKTPPGQPIEQINTLRPIDDPKVSRVYYRLRHDKSTVLAKTHLPLALNDSKLARIYQQFLAPEYEVASLPSYRPEISANPFKVYEAIPTSAKYQFMLDEAQLVIMGFIKGPVCRGQVALNVINDHFWVFFVDPDKSSKADIGQFLAKNQDVLTLPAQDQSAVLPVASWFKYAQAQLKYFSAKMDLMNTVFEDTSKLNLDLIWQGEGHNHNAALTIFRHFDSATVTKGLVGQPPKTAWVIDYALFERIHYLLVAGFDVYGNVGHQLNTRLYMDFLRIEGEQNFLALLPANIRERTHQYWYRNATLSFNEYMQDKNRFIQESGVAYQTDDPQTELYTKLKQHLKPVLSQTHEFTQDDFSQLRALEQVSSHSMSHLPQVSFILIPDNDSHRAYSIIKNNAHFNITSLLNEASQRAYAEDTLTVARGFIGDYPAVIWYVSPNEVSSFISQLKNIKTLVDYQVLKSRFAIRRTDPDFWKYSDLLHDVAKQYTGDAFGLFDYNRFENR